MAKKDNNKKKSNIISKVIIWGMVLAMAFPAVAALLGALL